MDPFPRTGSDIERGKALIVRFVTTSDAHEDGTRTVFFQIATVPVTVGQRLTRDGVIKEIVVKPGVQVDAKDLLIVLD